jgi:class 3 adenylate cyclase/predicted RNA-binding Zn-ribbon protein involved in translation (DUF1610 family)
MDCPYWGRANRAGANFCRFCGTHFVMACPRCRTVLMDDSAFCDNCGFQLQAPTSPPAHNDQATMTPAAPDTRLAARAEAIQPFATRSDAGQPDTAARMRAWATATQRYIPTELMRKLEAARVSGQMVGERRVVTMLFCDVKGSTAAAEQLDAEDYSEIMNGAFEHMIKLVYHYEGMLARLMGDAILAFFGAPIAHEDDPQRAVLAGLDIVSGIAPYRDEILAKWGIDFNVRVGINTGLVVVGAVGSDLRLEYSALGDAINVAARMEQTAEPGTVRIAHDTYKAVMALFDFEALGGQEVKGKAGPVLTYRVLGRKSVAGRARGIEGLRAEMVGRKAELQTLRGVINDLKQGVGRIVVVLGEAGLGKSRLVNEAHGVFDDQLGARANWFETSSLSYETNQAYGLILRLMRRMHGIDYKDPTAAIRAKLAAAIDRLPEASRARARQVLESLFGLDSDGHAPPMDSDTFKAELFEAIEAGWRVGFGQQPTVLAFDDLHWSDASSIELLQLLLPLTGQIPLVLICVLRSERQAPAW